MCIKCQGLTLLTYNHYTRHTAKKYSTKTLSISFSISNYSIVNPLGNHLLKSRHEIFPEFSGIPEFSPPQRSFSWKSQIRFNIYGGGGGRGTIYSVCSLSAGTARHKSSQASGVYTMSTFTIIYYNSLIFCIVCVCISLLILRTVVCHFKTISGYNSDHCLYVL